MSPSRASRLPLRNIILRNMNPTISRSSAVQITGFVSFTTSLPFDFNLLLISLLSLTSFSFMFEERLYTPLQLAVLLG